MKKLIVHTKISKDITAKLFSYPKTFLLTFLASPLWFLFLITLPPLRLCYEFVDLLFLYEFSSVQSILKC